MIARLIVIGIVMALITAAQTQDADDLLAKAKTAFFEQGARAVLPQFERALDLYRQAKNARGEAIALVGGEDRLLALLGVTWQQLQAWLDARAAVPTVVFLKLVDLLERTPARPAQELHQFLAPDYAPATSSSRSTAHRSTRGNNS